MRGGGGYLQVLLLPTPGPLAITAAGIMDSGSGCVVRGCVEGVVVGEIRLPSKRPAAGGLSLGAGEAVGCLAWLWRARQPC